MINDIQKKRLVGGIIAFLAIVSLYFVVKLINEIRAGEYIGTKDTPSTITVAGDGEVYATADIATISFTARGLKAQQLRQLRKKKALSSTRQSIFSKRKVLLKKILRQAIAIFSHSTITAIAQTATAQLARQRLSATMQARLSTSRFVTLIQ